MRTKPIGQEIIDHNIERIAPLVREAISGVGQKTFVALTDPKSSPKEFSDARNVFAYSLARAIVEAQLELTQGPPLENYEGFVIINIQPTNSSELIEPNSVCNLVITFSPTFLQEDGYVGDITIKDGVDIDEVEFELAFDQEDEDLKNPFENAPDASDGTIKVLVKPGETRELKFPFKTPPSIGTFPAWVQVSQKGRLIQNVRIDVTTTE